MEFHYDKILIGLDNSDVSKKAFKRAVQIAKRDGAELILAHVVDTKTFSSVALYDDEIYERSQEFSKKMLDDYEQSAKKANFVDMKKIIKMGSPKAVLVKEIIPEENVGLIILGATGIGTAAERIFMGSVSNSVSHHAPCDVLIVR